MKTYVPRREDVPRAWWVVDANGLTLGRLATAIASRLRGKHRALYTPYLDTGDHVVVVNADKIVLTGRKWTDKIYRRHSQYPGGLTEITARDLLKKHPERLVEHAVCGMLPRGPLGRRMARKLKVYAGPNHPHAPQKPAALDLPDARRAEA
jgi:large subunit ribosomal protein L13